MSIKQVQHLKKSICKVLGSHRAFNYKEPYIREEAEQSGGTAFFVDPKEFGENFKSSVNKRYLLTNFHVVSTLESNCCTLHYPEYGMAYITAKVEFVIPKLDVAILSIDITSEQPMWVGNLSDYLDGVPNLKLSESIVKGNSQKVLAIGFPNLSKDYQICHGIISGRGLGMIQLNISLNGGNSGGPLLFNGYVIGICTASISESEALGLAVPMTQILHFFQKWSKFDSTILDIPCWGVTTMATSRDYLEFNDIDKIKGVLVNKVFPDTGMSKFKERDILMSIESNGISYDIDMYGLISVDWTDKKIPIHNDEFILSLDPNDIKISYYNNRLKEVKTRKVSIAPIKFKVRDKHASWEPIPYYIVGGAVFMDLTMNHLQDDSDDEYEGTIPSGKVIPITAHLADTLRMEETVVCTFIPFQSHIQNQRNLEVFDRIVKVNKKKVKNVKHFKTLVEQDTSDFLVLDTATKKIYLKKSSLVKDDIMNILKEIYPKEKALLSKKRKRLNNSS